jgi:hypothetical protein
MFDTFGFEISNLKIINNWRVNNAFLIKSLTWPSEHLLNPSTIREVWMMTCSICKLKKCVYKILIRYIKELHAIIFPSNKYQKSLDVLLHTYHAYLSYYISRVMVFICSRRKYTKNAVKKGWWQTNNEKQVIQKWYRVRIYIQSCYPPSIQLNAIKMYGSMITRGIYYGLNLY